MMWVAKSYGGTELALICKKGKLLLSAEEDPLHKLYVNERKYMGDVNKLLNTVSELWVGLET